ncbi:DoxX family protein [Tardiphaga sp. vice352]|uniref:DoxX family protein n=1 Tax=unclassified Tardiphaga TaxID=2631404 RepID=UPI00116206C4|nr:MULTISPECIES: DoxX family protein [unclassified Tardiphaga]QDM16358.1 DoxX family protein [Tardiphaga sp. vice278]QDM21382.1 DoxX family protein [Tardiphaga sp. vice154]QDM26568.1 DoxX family protein [Tardiphaga sp. vice304]QDM31634.1 DoxX family protein [Tardiphaga sp. vice352]
MFITTDDFRIKAENFDLTNGTNILRIACGAFLIPHVMGKFAAGGLSAGVVGFFAKAGFHPPEAWVALAAAAEIVAAITMILGICTRFAALGSFALLLVTVYALHMVKGFGWTWNTGGYEYPVFWAIASGVVALEAWKVTLKRSSATRAPVGMKLAA